MAFWNRNKKTKVTGFAEQDNSGEWFQYFMQYNNLLQPDKIKTFQECDAYSLATNLAEIFIPIDAIADRASSIKYVLRYTATGEVYEPKGNLKKKIEQPNPVDRFNDLIYQSVFSKYATGQSFIYTKIPDSYKYPTVDNISNIWVLNPGVTKAKLLKEVPNPFLIKDQSELVEYYKTFFLYDHKIAPLYVTHRTSTGMNERFEAKSPLIKCHRNINNLLAVYQARYNVYAKNGNGGILSRDGGKNMGNMEEVVDPVNRAQIIKDLQDRNGITGNKNFIGISSIPLKFLKTLGTISELQPFEETEADMVTIGGIFGVNKYLLPIKEGVTFANFKDAEKGLWQNVIKAVCQDEAKDFSKAYALPEGIEFVPDFSDVEVLQEDKKTALESDGLLIDNLDKLREAGQNVDQAYGKIVERYNDE